MYALRVHIYTPRLALMNEYIGTHHTPPWGVFFFSSSIARQPRGCQCRTTRLRKALGETFPTSTCFCHRWYSNCRDIDHRNRPRGGWCCIQSRVRYPISLECHPFVYNNIREISRPWDGSSLLRGTPCEIAVSPSSTPTKTEMMPTIRRRTQVDDSLNYEYSGVSVLVPSDNCTCLVRKINKSFPDRSTHVRLGGNTCRDGEVDLRS